MFLLRGEKFIVIQVGVRHATPLYAALVMIELTDLLFESDGIPAIFDVTTYPCQVFSSNIFAMPGLRSMNFIQPNMLEKFHYIKYSVIAILIFVSLKLLAIHFMDFPEWFSLLFWGCSFIGYLGFIT